MKLTIETQNIQSYSVDLRRMLALETKNVSIMEELAKDTKSIIVLRDLSLNPEIPSHILKKLSEIEDNILRKNIAKHKNADKETIERVTKNGSIKTSYSSDFRKKLALETKDISVMEELAKDTKSIIVLRALSLNQDLPTHILSELAEIEDNILQRNVARHKNTDKETLAKLAKNRSNTVRRAVANNENTDPEVLHYLAYDCNDLVRLGVGNNPSTKKKTLLVLKNESAEAARRLLYC